jgi:hypothetical protein
MAASKGFAIFVLIFSILLIGYTAASIAYYKKIAGDQTCTAISKGNANAMWGFSIFFLILAGAAFFYSLYNLIFSPKEQEAHLVAAALPSQGLAAYRASLASATAAGR